MQYIQITQKSNKLKVAMMQDIQIDKKYIHITKNQFTLPKINSDCLKSIHMAKNQFTWPKINSDCQKLSQIAKN
jgi:hypothetical protein